MKLAHNHINFFKVVQRLFKNTFMLKCFFTISCQFFKGKRRCLHVAFVFQLSCLLEVSFIEAQDYT